MVQILKERIWIPVIVLLLAVLASTPVFAAYEGENPAGSDESVFEQESNSDDNELALEAEDVLTLREIDDSSYTFIETTEVPLAASPLLGAWAFVNLLTAIVGLIISALTVVTLLAGKEPSGEVSDGYAAYRVFGFNPRNTMLLKLIGASLGVASVVLFLLTEDVHGVMRLIDDFTWPMALIVFVQIAIVAASFGIDKRLRGAGPPSL
jgi:hypothetical protein